MRGIEERRGNKMTIEEMTIMSYIFLVIAILLGIIAVILFFVWKIPKSYRAVKGQKRRKGKVKQVSKLREKKTRQAETVRLDTKQQEKMQFTTLQDITFVHTEEET